MNIRQTRNRSHQLQRADGSRMGGHIQPWQTGNTGMYAHPLPAPLELASPIQPVSTHILWH
ncbi:hypothetical protein EMPG_17643 [Blastomyces silverae]|uniref:Uncharacterized protein n=1 Tax=Blastomyces silverae TaxID=2060906 RepID=A0A0H1B734_9EURO|nr:hypothetical protein EMPG_17643 [Blastomyces silverae]